MRYLTETAEANRMLPVSSNYALLKELSGYRNDIVHDCPGKCKRESDVDTYISNYKSPDISEEFKDSNTEEVKAIGCVWIAVVEIAQFCFIYSNLT